MILTDIQFRHSGGLFNTDPNLDLGGTMSNFQLSGISLNNLFDDIAGKASRSGLIDYRCFYILNTHSTDSVRNLHVWIEGNSEILIDLGVNLQNEIQKLVITNDSPAKPNEGDSMTLLVPNYQNFTVDYDINITKWTGNFQTEIRAVDGLNNVIITSVGNTSTGVTFTISYIGEAESHQISLIQVIADNLDNATIAAMSVKDGSPVNTEAPIIASKTIAPPAIDFLFPLKGNPLKLGNLRPLEAFPVWVRRTIPEGTLARTNNNFMIRFNGVFP